MPASGRVMPRRVTRTVQVLSVAGQATRTLTAPFFARARAVRMRTAGPVRSLAIAPGGGARTATEVVAVPVAPSLSVTRRRTTGAPGVGKLVVTVGVAPVLRSKLPLPSRSHSYLAMVPSSVEAAPLKVTCWPVTIAGRLGVMAAVGARCTRTTSSAMSERFGAVRTRTRYAGGRSPWP